MGPGEREEFHDRRHGFPVPAVRLQRAPMVVLIVQARLVARASERQPRRAPQFETEPRTESRATYVRRQCLQPMVYRDARKGKLVGAVFDRRNFHLTVRGGSIQDAHFGPVSAVCFGAVEGLVRSAEHELGIKWRSFAAYSQA
jgi:hypothetical protein